MPDNQSSAWLSVEEREKLSVNPITFGWFIAHAEEADRRLAAKDGEIERLGEKLGRLTESYSSLVANGADQAGEIERLRQVESDYQTDRDAYAAAQAEIVRLREALEAVGVISKDRYGIWVDVDKIVREALLAKTDVPRGTFS